MGNVKTHLLICSDCLFVGMAVWVWGGGKNYFCEKIRFSDFFLGKKYHDVGYLKDPILKICDFSANMYHMNMIFRFLDSLLLGLSLECFLIIFGHFFEILCHFEFDVYFWAADSLPISQKWKYGENHPKYHLMNIFPF